eukprot:68715-Prymnesium_polylepis.1
MGYTAYCIDSYERLSLRIQTNSVLNLDTTSWAHSISLDGRGATAEPRNGEQAGSRRWQRRRTRTAGERD